MDNIFLFVVGIFLIVFYANRGGDRETVEGFNDTISKMSVTDLQNLIYSTYKADVQAIKNLADTAAKLQAGGLTVPGNLNVSGNISGPTVNDLNTKITNAINNLTNTINAKYNELNTNLTNNINAKYNELNNRISSVNGDLSNKINTKVTKDAWFAFKGYRNRSVGDVQPVRIGWNWALQCNGGENNGDLFQINQ